LIPEDFPDSKGGRRVEQTRCRLIRKEISQFLEKTPSGWIMNKMMA
jgi:hypothetical protein